MTNKLNMNISPIDKTLYLELNFVISKFMKICTTNINIFPLCTNDKH